MIPSPNSMSLQYPPFEVQTSPELRRMEMINRARREELDAMVYGMSPRSAFTSRVVRKSPARGTTLFSKVTGSFGGVLIAAGQRLQAVR